MCKYHNNKNLFCEKCFYENVINTFGIDYLKYSRNTLMRLVDFLQKIDADIISNKIMDCINNINEIETELEQLNEKIRSKKYDN